MVGETKHVIIYLRFVCLISALLRPKTEKVPLGSRVKMMERLHFNSRQSEVQTTNGFRFLNKSTVSIQLTKTAWKKSVMTSVIFLRLGYVVGVTLAPNRS